MELKNAIEGRRSVRSFSKRGVSRATLEKVLQAAQWAPSACNKQMWEFIVVRDDGRKRRLADEAKAVSFIKDAPVVIYTLYRKDVNPDRHANIQSASAAVQNMLLMAHSLGMGSVWICHYGRDDGVRRILGVPGAFEIVCAVAMGYPATKPAAPKRRPLNDILHEESYSSSGKALKNDPRKWDEKEATDYRNKGIRATSPSPNAHDPAFTEELKTEVLLASRKIKGLKVLDVLGFSGSYTTRISEHPRELHVHDTSRDSLEFIKERKRMAGAGGTLKASVGGLYRLPYPDGSFDAVTCFKKLELVPEPEKLLSEISRVTKKGGRLVVSFWKTLNVPSINYGIKVGILGRSGISSNEGPSRPIPAGKVKAMIRKAGFRIIEETGINIMPNRSFGRKLNLEGRPFGGPLRRLCRTILLECEKV